MIFDAKDYKFAKIVTNDLNNVLEIMDAMENLVAKLKPYRRYRHVNLLVEQYRDSISVLEIQYKKYLEIRDKKGIKNGR